MRLIDADALRKDLSDLATLRSGSPVTSGLIQAMYIVNDAPTVEAEPVRHGRWMSVMEPHHVCSECDHWFHLYDCVKYCPNCGARMDGGGT